MPPIERRTGWALGMRVWLAAAFALVLGLPARGSDAVVLGFQDVPEQERRELAEREFVSTSAHELRTPLQTILGAVEALRAGAKEDPQDLERFLGHIEREGRLIGNAVGHTEARQVTLATRPLDGGTIAVDIADAGPGIPDGARPHVLDRFFRSGERGADGFGLGPALAIGSKLVPA